MDLKELTLVNPQTNWYYRAKLHAILRLITKHSIHPVRIIDVGAGSGFFGKSIKERYPNSGLDCIDTNYKENSIDIDGTVYKKDSNGVVGDTYLFIDVLEHVDDDLGLVNEYIKNAAGANVIITVPAFMSLWSGHDVFLEHKRRYTRKEISKLCSELDLQELESGYLFSSIFPIAYVIRKIKRKNTNQSSMKESNLALNFLLRSICSIEHHFFRNPFFGLSTYLVARK